MPITTTSTKKIFKISDDGGNQFSIIAEMEDEFGWSAGVHIASCNQPRPKGRGFTEVDLSTFAFLLHQVFSGKIPPQA